MNKRAKELEKEALDYAADTLADSGHGGILEFNRLFTEKYAELIIEDCCRALNPMLRDMISRGQGVDAIKQHFGVDK